MRFLKNGCNGGMENLYSKWGEARNEGGIGFEMGGWEICKVSLHSWQRSANLLFYEDPPYIAYPPATPFSNFDHPSSPPPIPTSNSYPHGLFCCPVSLAEWVITPHLMYYFT